MTLSRRTFLAVATTGAATVTGCASRTTASGVTNVRIWSWLTGTDEYVAAFNADQNEVFVELNVIASGLKGGYAQQINAIRAHNAPDILHAEYQALPQFNVAADAVRRADPTARTTTFPLNDGSSFAGRCWQTGDPWCQVDHDSWRVDIASEGTLRTANYWQTMIAGGLVHSDPVHTQDWIAAIHTGKLWAHLGASWNVGTFAKSVPQDKNRWAVTTMPTWGAPAADVQDGSAFAVSAESRVAGAAVKFLRWLSTDPAVPRIGSTFSAPFPAYLPNMKVARVPDWTWGPDALNLFATIAAAGSVR